MITVEVTRDQSESSSSVIRRFSKKVLGASIIKKAKSLKSRERVVSHYKKKKATLKRINRRAEIERLKKLGKIATTNVGYQRSR